jgi:hypothetical protein
MFFFQLKCQHSISMFVTSPFNFINRFPTILAKYTTRDIRVPITAFWTIIYDAYVEIIRQILVKTLLRLHIVCH